MSTTPGTRQAEMAWASKARICSRESTGIIAHDPSARPHPWAGRRPSPVYVPLVAPVVVAEASTGREPVDREQDQRSEDGRDQAGPRAGVAVPAASTPDEAGRKRAADAEEHGRENATGISARHDELRERARDESNDECSDEV